MTDSLTIKQINEQTLAELFTDTKLSRFGPVKCGQCNRNEGFSRRVFEISGMTEKNKSDVNTQKLIRHHLHQHHAVESAFFRTFKNRFLADSAKCFHCGSTAIIFDILDIDCIVSEISKLSGKSEDQIHNDIKNLLAKPI